MHSNFRFNASFIQGHLPKAHYLMVDSEPSAMQKSLVQISIIVQRYSHLIVLVDVDSDRSSETMDSVSQSTFEAQKQGNAHDFQGTAGSIYDSQDQDMDEYLERTGTERMVQVNNLVIHALIKYKVSRIALFQTNNAQLKCLLGKKRDLCSCPPKQLLKHLFKCSR